jgi:hypothetical protein
MRRPSILIRALRAATAVVTLWCLGCSGFEPLLDAALGAESTVMSCGADAGAMAASTDGASHHATVSAAADSHHGFDCGCGSCHSASPSTFALSSAQHLAPTTAFARIIALVSVVRTPLLPPPQITA